MIRKTLAITALIATHLGGFAQNEENFWIFGHPEYQNGTTIINGLPITLNFAHPSAPLPSSSIAATNAGSPAPAPNDIALADGVYLGWEGSGVATDPVTGELYFYTDGDAVYNDSHADITPAGRLGGHSSSSQPVALCINPESINADCEYNEYYIFSNPTSGTTAGPVTYRIYDRVLNLFSGTNSLPLLASDGGVAPVVSEGMLTVPSGDPAQPDLFWLITHLYDSNVFRVYRIDATGISAPVDHAIGPNIPLSTFSVGTFAYQNNSFRDPSKGELAVTNAGAVGQTVYTVLFDGTTGIMSSPLTIANDGDITTGGLEYDVEFSPDGSKLYFTTSQWSGAGGGIHQYNFATSTLNSDVHTQNRLNGIKRGPDGNIYFIYWTGGSIHYGTTTTLGRITSPNLDAVTDLAFAPSINSSYQVFSDVAALNFPEFVTVPEKPLCCSAANDSTFVTIDYNINSNTYWDGKIYIPDNTIITVSNDAILDITTADVVFGDCSGIDFTDGAMLRANNSVFRPCAFDGTWRGLLFSDETDFSHQINESTFKNAEIALHFTRNGNGLINANTFSNCNEGIFVNNSLFKESIVANNFITNKSFPEYNRCYNFTDPNDVINIHVVSASFGNNRQVPIVISENSFIMTNQSNEYDLTGIDIMNGVSSITANNFTNMRTGVSIDAPAGVTNIENNEMEVNNNFSTPFFGGGSSQINIDNATGPLVLVNNNQITNTSNISGFSVNGIFSLASTNVNLINNKIDECNWGIVNHRCSAIKVSENIITSAVDGGIYLKEEEARGYSHITCNDITMQVNQGTGIVLYDAIFTQVTSNCVKDANVGMLADGTGTIPYIRNNFFYNYEIGINNLGHTGNIGTSSDPGINTLWSNSNSTDISSTTSPLNIANNFGVFNMLGSITVTQNKPYHSTASCATQIFDYDNQENLNTSFTCQTEDQMMSPVQRQAAGYDLPSVELILQHIDLNKNAFNTISKITNFYSVNETYLLDLMNQIELTELEESKIWYNFYKQKGNYSLALAELDKIDNDELKEIERLHLKAAFDIELSAEDLSLLEQLSTSENSYDSRYNMAVTVSKTTANHGSYDYTLPVIKKTSIDESQISRVTKNEISLMAYPNPTSSKLTVEVLNGSDNNNYKLAIYSVSGELIKEQDIRFISGKVELNIENLVNGIYFISLESELEHIDRVKIIKIK